MILILIGILLYELIHKKAPYKGRRMEDVKKRIKENRVIFKKDIEPEIKSIIFQMLQMMPKMRPSVSEILRNPFIQNIRQKMDTSFFAKNQQSIRTSGDSRNGRNDHMGHPSKKGGNFNKTKSQDVQNKGFMFFQNKKIFYKKGQSSDIKPIVPKGAPINSSLVKNLSKKFSKLKSSKCLNKTTNYKFQKNDKFYNSSKNIVSSSFDNQSRPKGGKLNQSLGDLQPFGSKHKFMNPNNFKLMNGQYMQQMMDSNNLLRQKFGKKMICKTDPIQAQKNKRLYPVVNNFDKGNGNKIFSKKKQMKVEVIQGNEELNNSMKMFKNKNQTNSKSTKKKEPKKSSKENMHIFPNSKNQFKPKQDPSSISNLKRLLKKSKETKNAQKEFTITLNSKHSSQNQNYISYNSHAFKPKAVLLNESMNLDFKQTNQTSKKSKHRSFILPKKKLKNDNSVRYINASHHQKAPAHIKSRSFNDNTIKSKLVMTRNDSIHDLKKKISNRKLNDSKQRNKSTYNNSSQSNKINSEQSQLMNKRIVSRKNLGKQQLGHLLPTLKRNHSTAHTLVHKTLHVGTGSLSKNQNQVKTPQSPINGFNVKKYYEKRMPVQNVFQLQSNNPGGFNNNSFSYSHRVNNLNQKPLFSKMKGHSHRNISMNIYKINESNASLQQGHSSVQKQASHYSKNFQSAHQYSSKQFMKNYVSVNHSIANPMTNMFQPLTRKVDFNS
jgi:hypothetical protein